MSFDAAARIADAVLYEGYALYPYRASAAKNRIRWQFGVLMPREFAEVDPADPWFLQTECLIEPEPDSRPAIDIRVRFLHVQARTIEVVGTDGERSRVARARADGRDLVEWDEGLDRTVDVLDWSVGSLLAGERTAAISCRGSRDLEMTTDEHGARTRIVRTCRPVRGRLRVSARPAGPFIRLRVRVENIMPGTSGLAGREAALPWAMAGTHTLLAVRGGRFISLLDPPDAAVAMAAACENLHTWPVLVGAADRRDLLLSAPIILYDFPEVAAESPGNLFDGTEIDEILSLRVMTMTDAEKQEARATDPRVREIIDRTEALPLDAMSGLHGAIRDLRQVEAEDVADGTWRDLLNPPGEAAPEAAAIQINGVRVARGSAVRIEPMRRADPIDLLVRGRTARVQGIYRDIDGRAYLAIVIDDDPGGDLHASFGRFLYYGPEEVVPL